MDPTQSGVTEPGSAESYTEDEERRLATNLEALAHRVHGGEFADGPHDLDLLRHFHACLFQEVRGHAGKERSHGFGSEYLTFGPNRSSHRGDVRRELEAKLGDLAKSIASFDDSPDDPDYSEKALELAAWIHAELIRIHPFQDGNGRSTRMFMNAVLIRLGLRPIAVEVCKETYCDVLNLYFVTKDRRPLVDLFLQLYAAELRER